MIRYFVDILPSHRDGDILGGGGDAANVLADRNPANAYSWTAASVILYIDLAAQTGDDYSEFLIPHTSCIALFGISKSLRGAEIAIRHEWPTSGYTSVEYTSIIDSDRMWIPLDDVGVDTVDSTNTVVGTLKITITQNTTGSYSLGELCIGLLETLRVNFVYGAQYNQSTNNTILTTRGGVEYAYNENSINRQQLALEWSQTLNDQDVAQIYRLYDRVGGGLYPFVIVPEEEDRSGARGCYYGRIPSDLQRVHNFIQRSAYTLQFSEAIAYEDLG